MKKAATISILAGMGVLAGSVLLANSAKAAPVETEQPGLIPTADDIMGAQSMGELEIWYIYIGQIYFTGQIDREAYEILYQAYVTRFYELTGASQ
ncbi:MAG: hypothetical protein PHV11_10305 [Candidatus Bipolaricaulis sp.]|nr:hypothetical protein [Dehalococcoidales bacterium]MDD5220949.1 hypothetical protein [Candidatus Bipolaricaulis sp.]